MSIAVVAVLLSHMDRRYDVNPSAKIDAIPLPFKILNDKRNNANFRSSPCKVIALARIKLPIKRKIISLANGANASRVVTTFKRAPRTGTSKAVTGNGTASPTHQRNTKHIIPSVLFCNEEISRGRNKTIKNKIGPANKVILFLHKSKEKLCSAPGIK